MIKLTDHEFTTLSQYVQRNYGINLTKKRTLIEGRLSNTLREMGLASYRQFMDQLSQDPQGEINTRLLNKLTTNHTFFMREKEHFDFLKNSILPSLLAQRKERVLRIWSAGCSSGQEAYTIAMVLHDVLGSEKSRWDTRILATDISTAVLEKGQMGQYPAESLELLPRSWQQQHFKDLGQGQVEILPHLRQEVIFKYLNLMEPFPFRKTFDLIFCRNVMIYFDEPTKQALVDKFYQASSPGGFLLIGHSEVISRGQTAFQYIKPAVYQKGGPSS